jgi:LmbE family N-acetylglucosaminyl deacetylase
LRLGERGEAGEVQEGERTAHAHWTMVEDGLLNGPDGRKILDPEHVLEPLDENWSRALAIAAHPDDLEYGVASAVARWTAQGKEVVYLLATRGEAGIAAMAPERTRTVREEEERRSAAVVGVSRVEFLDKVDGEIEYGLALRRDLARSIRRLQPEVVIGLNFELTWGSSGNVNHSDHRAVGRAILDACRDAANEWVFRDAGAAWRGVKALYIAATSSPTHYVDVTDSIGRGIASLEEHRAYIDGLGTSFDPDEFLRNFSADAGALAGCDLAVLFQAFNAV